MAFKCRSREICWLLSQQKFAREPAALFLLGCCGVVAVVSGFGLRLACIVGRFSANRNVTFVATVASFGLPSLSDVYVAACFIPLFALPFLVKFAASFLSRGGLARGRERARAGQTSVLSNN